MSQRKVEFSQGPVSAFTVDYNGRIQVTFAPDAKMDDAVAKMRRVMQRLRITPEEFPRFAGEIKDSRGEEVIPHDDIRYTSWIWNTDGNIQQYQGSDTDNALIIDGNSITISDIAIANIDNMASKTIRAMLMEELLNPRQAVAAHYKLNLPRTLLLSSGNIGPGRE